MEHIVKLRKIALADIEAEQLKIKSAKEANRKKASIIVKVALDYFLCLGNFALSESVFSFPGEACVDGWKHNGGRRRCKSCYGSRSGGRSSGGRGGVRCTAGCFYVDQPCAY
jgi:hypothetical protein